MNELETGTLLAAACDSTGLQDFGEPPVEAALDVLTRSLQEEARLNAAGVAGRVETLQRQLANRLRFTELLKNRPELHTTPIGAPLFLVGLPRSGTTKMQRLIAADRSLNHIPLWENLYPVPLSDAADDREVRIAHTQAFVDFIASSPQFQAAHELEPLAPEEEHVLMEHAFLGESIDCVVDVPGFLSWLKQQDRRPMYTLLRRFMAYLEIAHGQVGQPWILKGCYHGPFMDQLLEVFPEAKIVYCHRDPVDTIPSYCSNVSNLRAVSSDHVDRHAVGAELLRNWSERLQQSLVQRQGLADGVLLDIFYPDIRRDAASVVESIYRFCGWELTEEASRSMAGWLNDNPQHKHGRHEYSLEAFGLERENMAEIFRDYRRDFLDLG